jgi:hypothetical protein
MISKKPKYSLAESKANQVLATSGMNQLPIDPFHIADMNEIQVGEKEFDGISGCFLNAGGVFAILHTNRINNTGFIRFTVAHELGHYFLPGHIDAILEEGGMHTSEMSFSSRNWMEKEADRFAAELLMPRSQFTPVVEKAGVGLQAIKNLSDLCITSLEATAIRYVEFTEDPVVVIVSKETSPAQIQYACVSPCLREIDALRWVEKGQLIPPGTETAHFHKNGLENGEAEGRSILDQWFADSLEVEMDEEVIRLGGSGRVLTVLSCERIETERSYDW